MTLQDQQQQQASAATAAGRQPNASANNSNTSTANASQQQQQQQRQHRAESPPIIERLRVFVHKDGGGGANSGGGGLGLSIAGGIESTPFVDNDPGLFISKLVAAGAAERAGLRVGDKVLEINSTPMVGQRHQVAVDCIQQRPDGVELFIHRQLKRGGGGNRVVVAPPPGREQSQSAAATTTTQGGPQQQPQPTQPAVVAIPSAAASQRLNTSPPTNNNSAPRSRSEAAHCQQQMAAVQGQLAASSHPPPQQQQSSTPSLPHSTSSTTPNFYSQSQRPTTPSQLTNTSFSSLPAITTTPTPTTTAAAATTAATATALASSTATAPQPQQKLPYAADLAFGDPQLVGVVEQIDLVRDSKHSLGLSIVGGVDHCSHPFGSPAHPGVFISKITTNSPAEMCRRLRIGDRILRVNGDDISEAKHNDAVEALRKTGRSLRLTVCHEAQPRGLRSVVIHRRDQQPLGLSICGGIGSSPVNPEDRTDEGIFIERVEPAGPADQSCVGLAVGMRILEVNDDSLLGCTKDEAAHIFRRASPGPVRLLVCEGFGSSIGAAAATNRPPLLGTITVATSPTMASASSGLDQQKQQQVPPPPMPMFSPAAAAIGVPLLLGNSPTPMPPSLPALNNGPIGPQHVPQHVPQHPPQHVPQHPPQQHAQPHPPQLSGPQHAPQHAQQQNGGNSSNNNNQQYQNISFGSSKNDGTKHQQQQQQQPCNNPSSINASLKNERDGVTAFSSEPANNKNLPATTMAENAGKNAIVGGGERIPPPVAPKPKVNVEQQHRFPAAAAAAQPSTNFSAAAAADHSNGTGTAKTTPVDFDASNNSSTKFSARLRQFEPQHPQSLQLQQQQQQQAAANPPPPPPSKRPLLSNEDLAKLAEDDRMRQQQRRMMAIMKANDNNGSGGNGSAAAAAAAATELVGHNAKKNGCGSGNVIGVGEDMSPMSPPRVDGQGQQLPSSFEHILNNSPIPLSQPVFSSIRSKKAENRFLQQQQQQHNLVASSQQQPQQQQQQTSAIDQLALEQQRRSEWRRARMASLEAESIRIGQLVDDVNEISRLKIVDEQQQQQHHHQLNERNHISDNNASAGNGTAIHGVRENN